MIVLKNTTKQINSPAFGHNNPWADSPYNKKQKALIAATTALGVAGSLALLAKHNHYSLKPNKVFKNFKNSYFYKVKYDEAPVIAIGAGSCLGGLAGGCIVDKNKENRKAKLRETILQITNISLPIIFTVFGAKSGEKIGKKMEKGIIETMRTKILKAIGGLAGLFAGVFFANIVANKINEVIFKRGKGRPVQATDFSAHLDDFCVAAQQISNHKFVHYVSRLVPIALLFAGNEVGNTSAANVNS